MREAETKNGARRRRFYIGAGNETRTRDPNLGKVVLYQLSYSRETAFERLTPGILIESRRENSGVP